MTINHEMLIAAGWTRLDDHPAEARPFDNAVEDCIDAGGTLGTVEQLAQTYRDAGWPEAEIEAGMKYAAAYSSDP
jgi:hypothetical protein